MIAKYLRYFQLLVFVLMAAVSWAGSKTGHAYFGLLVVPAVMAAYGLILAVEFTLLSLVDRAPSTHPRGSGPLIRAWMVELIWALRVFAWHQPWRHRAIGNLQPCLPVRGLVLVHGLMCNRGFWNPWMKQLTKSGVPFVAVTLPDVLASIDTSVNCVEEAVAQMQTSTGMAPLIVAHSMGGLVVRAWLAQAADCRVHHIVTIATPHHGTWLAKWAFGRSTKEMRLGSRWLQDLFAAEPSERYRRFTCFHGRYDNVVFPMRSAILPGATNVLVDGAAHISMAFQPMIYAEVLRLRE